MNPILRELQRQLNDIAKQLDALQRQETLNALPSNMATYSGTPTADSLVYWAGAGTIEARTWDGVPGTISTHTHIEGDLFAGNDGANVARVRLGANANQAFLQHNRYYDGGASQQMDTSKPSWAITLESASDYLDIARSPAGSTTMASQMRVTTTGVGIGATTVGGKAHIDQASTTAAIPVLILDQADLSEEFIEFTSTVGAGNPIDTAAIGTYYGKIRVNVTGVGYKYLALYNT